MAKRFFNTLWYLLREACGENDYRRYCDRLVARGETPLNGTDFYLSNLQRKYSRPNRCC